MERRRIVIERTRAQVAVRRVEARPERALAAIVLTLLTLLVLARPAFAETAVFELSRMNGTWTDLATEPQPFTTGGLTIAMRSPAHWLTVHDNQVLFVPNGDGTLRATISATFEGGGDLIADVLSGGQVTTSFEDKVTVPRQTVAVTGRVRLARGADGWHLTFLDLPSTAAVRIESQLLGSLADSCNAMSLFLALDCKKVRNMVGSVDVDLPEPGTEVVIPDDWLTAHEAGVLAGLVGG